MFTWGAMAQVTLTIPTVNAPSSAGGAVTMPVNVTNFTNVGAITLKITYDTAVVSYTGIANTATGITFTVGSGTPGVLNLGWFDATGTTPVSVSSGGKLVDLNFTYKKGSSTIAFVSSACDIANAAGTSFSGVVYTNGTLQSTTNTTLTIPTINAPDSIGGAVTLPVNVSNFTNVGAITLKITYDPAVMQYTGIANTASGVAFTVGSGTAGVLNLGWFDQTGISPVSLTSGKLVDLNFKYLGGSSNVGFTTSACDIANGSGLSITGIVYQNGKLQAKTVGAATVTIPNVQAPAAGGAVSMPINVTNFSQIGAITLKITYDTAAVSYTGIANAAAGVAFTVGSGTPGVLNLGWFDATGITPVTITSGKLVDLNFTYKKGTGTFGFTTSACDIANGSGTSLTGVVYTNGSLYAPTVTPTLTIPTVQSPGAGGAVTVPINVTNFTGVGAITLKLAYDPAVLTFVSVANAATGVTFTVGSNVVGVLNLGWFDATGNTPMNLATGKLVDLNFTYLGGTSAVGFTTSGCDIANSSGVSFTCVYTGGSVTLGAPVAPVLQTPINGAVNQPQALTLTWGSVSGAATYRVQVATDSLFTAANIVVNDSTVSTNSRALSGLLNSVKYYWRVNAKNAVGTSSYSTVSNFTIIMATPATPVLRTPANNATNQALSLTLQWDSVAGAATYRVQVATDTLFASLVVNDSTVATKSKAVSGLLYNNKYYWRVNAKNIAGTSSYSSVFNFTTISTPAVPVLLSPANNTIDQPQLVVLSWGAVTGATKYIVQLATDFQFTALVLNDSSRTSTTTNRLTLDQGKQYYWRVAAVNAAGTSAFSTVFNFKILTTGVDIVVGDIPKEFSLVQNFPNPFNPTTNIRYGLPHQASVTMEIYNMLGVKVRTLLHGETMSAGVHQMSWDGKNDAGVSVTSGVYLYRIVAGSFQSTMKMMMLK